MKPLPMPLRLTVPELTLVIDALRALHDEDDAKTGEIQRLVKNLMSQVIEVSRRRNHH